MYLKNWDDYCMCYEQTPISMGNTLDSKSVVEDTYSVHTCTQHCKDCKPQNNAKQYGLEVSHCPLMQNVLCVSPSVAVVWYISLCYPRVLRRKMGKGSAHVMEGTPGSHVSHVTPSTTMTQRVESVKVSLLLVHCV